MDIVIRPATAGDAAALCHIYNRYVENTCTTFETEPVSTPGMARRIADTAAMALPWLVAEVSGDVIGYACASRWKGRCAYRNSIESTIYLDASQTGQGIGLQLYAALIDTARTCALHTIIGGIALPNAASVGLHERLGFRKVAHFEQVGHKLGRWIDVGYWQLLL